jgi:hypothetical protein
MGIKDAIRQGKTEYTRHAQLGRRVDTNLGRLKAHGLIHKGADGGWYRTTPKRASNAAG